MTFSLKTLSKEVDFPKLFAEWAVFVVWFGGGKWISNGLMSRLDWMRWVPLRHVNLGC